IFLACCGKENLSALQPAGEIGKQQFFLIVLSISIMLLVVGSVAFTFTFAVLKSRSSKVGEECVPIQVASNYKLEIIWITIPIILLIILAITTVWITFKQADVEDMVTEDGVANKDSVIVNVTAYQYWWEF